MLAVTALALVAVPLTPAWASTHVLSAPADDAPAVRLSDHNCVHDAIPQTHVTVPQAYAHPGYDHVPDGDGGVTRVLRRRLAQDAWGSIRITPYYNLDGTNAAKEAWMRDTVVPAAVGLLEAALRVDPVAANLMLSRPCASYWGTGKCQARSSIACGHTTVPEDHYAPSEVCTGPSSGCSDVGGPGAVATDTVIYVTVQQTGTCGTNTLACTCARRPRCTPLLSPRACARAALRAHCPVSHGVAGCGGCRRGVVRDGSDGPPDARVRSSAAGAFLARPSPRRFHAPFPGTRYINICPDRVVVSDEELPEWVNTVRHEIIHVLGFSSWHYAFFRDADGNPLTPRDGNGSPSYEVIDCHGSSYWYPMPATTTVQSFTERGCVRARGGERVRGCLPAAAAHGCCCCWQVRCVQAGGAKPAGRGA